MTPNELEHRLATDDAFRTRCTEILVEHRLMRLDYEELVLALSAMLCSAMNTLSAGELAFNICSEAINMEGV